MVICEGSGRLLSPERRAPLTCGRARLRSKRKWTQTDLALSADVDRNYVSLIELGRNSPSVRMMFRLCDVLDIAPSDMLQGSRGPDARSTYGRADQESRLSLSDNYGDDGVAKLRLGLQHLAPGRPRRRGQAILPNAD
ncbi:helix-turn-helix transcriptional regulator [Paucibacter sp. PLA-PC-4]|nr:helix-turn-helix transcriptional regulator [Paucibacter sp. PLA-PC-4]